MRRCGWTCAEVRSNPKEPLRTPDGRYMVVRGRLWRLPNPAVPPDRRAALVQELMDARRALKKSNTNAAVRADAKRRVHAAKTALGERGPPWWNTPYAAWYVGLQG
jgi:hypothetical protein